MNGLDVQIVMKVAKMEKVSEKDLGRDGDPAILLAVITGVEEAMKGNG